MSEIKPVAWLSTDCIGERFLCFSRPRDNDKCEDLYAIPNTHRIVSGELLEDLEEACAIAEYWGLLESLQAIIDKEQS
jgi:hypothetical protein